MEIFVWCLVFSETIYIYAYGMNQAGGKSFCCCLIYSFIYWVFWTTSYFLTKLGITLYVKKLEASHDMQINLHGTSIFSGIVCMKNFALSYLLLLLPKIQNWELGLSIGSHLTYYDSLLNMYGHSLAIRTFLDSQQNPIQKRVKISNC